MRGWLRCFLLLYAHRLQPAEHHFVVVAIMAAKVEEGVAGLKRMYLICASGKILIYV